MSGDHFADEDAAILARERERHMAVLRDIPAQRRQAAERERTVVHYARLLGIGWDDIAAAIDGTADQALGQYGEPEPGTEPF